MITIKSGHLIKSRGNVEGCPSKVVCLIYISSVLQQQADDLPVPMGTGNMELWQKEKLTEVYEYPKQIFGWECWSIQLFFRICLFTKVIPFSFSLLGLPPWDRWSLTSVYISRGIFKRFSSRSFSLTPEHRTMQQFIQFYQQQSCLCL